MEAVTLADAKDRLEELVGRAEAGETVAIVSNGKAVAHLSSAAPPRRAIDLNRLRALTEALPPSGTEAGLLVRDMRDDRV